MSIDSDLIRGHVDTIILKTLADGDKYGYEIIKEIENKSKGTYELKQPTLYSCLKRLESQGFISAYWVNSEIGGRRHYYKLTEQGRAEYTSNMNEWLSSRSIIDDLISNEIPDYQNKDYELASPVTKPSEESIQEQIAEVPKNDAINFNLPEAEKNPYINNENEEGNGSTLNNTENLNIIEDYYKTDENQCNLFNLNSAESSKNENTEEYNPSITSAISQTTSTTTEEYGIKDETTGTNTIPQGVKIDGVQGIATKFNIKDYKTNSATFFNSVKDVENFDEAEYPTEHTYVSTVEQPSKTTPNYFSSNTFDDILNEDTEPIGSLYSEPNKKDDEPNDASQNDTENTTQSYLNFGEEDDENKPDIQDRGYWNKGFTIKDDNTTSFRYDYDRDEELSDSTDLTIKEDYPTPSIDEDMPLPAETSDDLDNKYYNPYGTDKSATTSLFVDNKRKFTPQYTDNESKSLLNTLSSYGSTNFTKASSTEKLQESSSSYEELEENLNKKGIIVTEYVRRPKEPLNVKNYIWCNKIKCTTSWIAYGITLLLLVSSFLIANTFNLVNFNMLSTTLPAYFYLFVFATCLTAVPVTFTVIYCLNKTKKVKAKFNFKVAIIFSILFFIQCLVIIYAINIPFGLYSFTQIDYNHFLWLLPAVCTCYIPIHTLIYQALYKSKKFHA